MLIFWLSLPEICAVCAHAEKFLFALSPEMKWLSIGAEPFHMGPWAIDSVKIHCEIPIPMQISQPKKHAKGVNFLTSDAKLQACRTAKIS